MENHFCISRKNLRDLVGLSRREFTQSLLNQYLRRFNRKEIEEQLNTRKGELVDAINTESNTFARPTENFEIIEAILLSDFYFPHDETEICFAIRRGVDPDGIKSFDSLISSLEDATHIDCSIMSTNKKLSFQLKRYPQKHLSHTNGKFLDWFSGVISHYGNMEGIILIVTLQPTTPLNRSEFNFPELSESLVVMKNDISFDEVAMTFNEINRYFILHKLFPEQKRLAIPVYWALKRFRGEV